MAEDAVRDLEHARNLVQRSRLGLEGQEVVRALGLVVDLVGEPAASPDVVALEGPASALDELPRARDDLVLPLLGKLGVEQQQDFVVDHVPSGLLRSESASPGASAARELWRRGAKQVPGDTVAAASCKAGWPSCSAEPWSRERPRIALSSAVRRRRLFQSRMS